MEINVRVVPKASSVSVIEEQGGLKVRLTRPASDGEANEQLIEILARHFHTKKYLVSIVRGHTSRNKTVRIEDGT
ncbi:MAG: DUF167 domain-containing protein [Deltaproteobacteria bacterium]